MCGLSLRRSSVLSYVGPSLPSSYLVGGDDCVSCRSCRKKYPSSSSSFPPPTLSFSCSFGPGRRGSQAANTFFFFCSSNAWKREAQAWKTG